MQAVEEKVLDYRYSVEQLQTLDFLLKAATLDLSHDNRNRQRNLKLVVERNNLLWHGDFIRAKIEADDGLPFISVCQLVMDEGSRYAKNQGYAIRRLDETHIEMELFKLAWAKFNESSKTSNHLPSACVSYNEDLSVIFNILTEVISDISFDDVTSPIYPYLLNAYCLNDKTSLPFLHIQGEKLKLVSIMEVTNASLEI